MEPKGVKVGDMLLIDGDNITISKEATEKLRKEIEKLMDELFEDYAIPSHLRRFFL